MNKRDRVKQMGFDPNKVDTALPQPWLDEMARKLHEDGKYPIASDAYYAILTNTVWSYHDSLFGRPLALGDELKVVEQYPVISMMRK